MLSNNAAGQTGSASSIQSWLQQNVSSALTNSAFTNYIGNWSLVWGPIVWQDTAANSDVADNVLMAAQKKARAKIRDVAKARGVTPDELAGAAEMVMLRDGHRLTVGVDPAVGSAVAVMEEMLGPKGGLHRRASVERRMDPFGLDPHLCDLLAPGTFAALVGDDSASCEEAIEQSAAAWRTPGT